MRPAKSKPVPLTDSEKKGAVSRLVQEVVAQLSGAMIDANSGAGWTQADVARRLAMDPALVSRWLSARNRNMTLETLALLSRALDMKPALELKPMLQSIPKSRRPEPVYLSAINKVSDRTLHEGTESQIRQRLATSGRRTQPYTAYKPGDANVRFSEDA